MEQIANRGDSPFEGLARAYSNVANSWHNSICKLGFMDAYEAMVENIDLDHLHRNRDDSNALRVLDAGCGTGGFSLALSTHTLAFSLDLMDLSSEMLDQAAALIKQEGVVARTIVGDIASYDFDGPKYDLILCAHLIEHVDDVGKVLRSMSKLLSSDGQIVFVVSKPHWCTYLLRLKWGYRAFAPQEFLQLLQKNGFENVEQHSFSDGPPSRLSMGYVAKLKRKPNEDS